LLAAAWQLRCQQSLIETQRQQIGEWLHAHRESPRDRVFLEPLGYIGFFSQLKMLDYPGLAAPEVIAARRKRGEDWIDLIEELQPEWIVARPGEPRSTNADRKAWFREHYRSVQTFDVGDKIDAIRFLPGRSFLRFDQTYVVFRRN
jgi:hypothetical protein